MLILLTLFVFLQFDASNLWWVLLTILIITEMIIKALEDKKK